MEQEFSRKLHNLEIQRAAELESHHSMTPDPEYFEIIDTIKSREESETKSDRSNGDWTKIGDKFKKEDLKSDNHSNYESISVDEKIENQSGLFENVHEGSLCSLKRIEDSVEDVESEPTSEPLKLSDNFNETISDALDEDLDVDCEQKIESPVEISNANEDAPHKETDILENFINSREVPNAFRKELLNNCDMKLPLKDDTLLSNFQDTPLNKLTLHQVVDVISNSLPKIIPNIILNRREVRCNKIRLSFLLSSQFLFTN